MGTIEQSIALDALIGIAEQINELKVADRLSEEEAECFEDLILLLDTYLRRNY